MAVRATRTRCVDGNEAVARVAYALSEVVAIYPITPASAMGELSDAWAAAGTPNLWGDVPEVIEMQSEAGAAGVLHGAVQRGALATTFTASQGLLLMVPNMYKIAGELSPTVIHVAARSVATHALSIFGDHSDVMAVRPTGFAMLCSGSVQEAHDLALVAHAASLESRVPFVHFFDGFRTSHEIDKIELLDDEDLTALMDERWIMEHRARALSPDHPVVRGTAQNPDVFFQAREAANPIYEGVADVVTRALGRIADRTGRCYGLVDYVGAPDADRVLVVMGSAAGAARETVQAMQAAGARVGVLVVRLFRPFPASALVEALPATVRSIAVLDRTKEPGAQGEPLYQDVVAALADASMGSARPLPLVIGSRYGLSSKEVTPRMLKGVFDELALPAPRRRVTVGIVDDVTHSNITPDPAFDVRRAATQAVLYGLGSDGTVSAAKAAVKMIGERTSQHAQGYFVYDSKKAGQVTVSHLRFDPDPIEASYLVDDADVVACHQFGFVERVDMLANARPGGVFLVNAPYGADAVWPHLPVEVQRQIVEKELELHVVDAHGITRDLGIAGRVNWPMLACFFALSGALPLEEAAAEIERVIDEQYARKRPEVVEKNRAAVRRALAELRRVEVPAKAAGSVRRRLPVADAKAPEFVKRVTAEILGGAGDLLPVSSLPVDGTFPTATSRYERRAIAQELPVWDPDLCIDCGRCTIVCPHSAIRMKAVDDRALSDAPPGFLSKPYRSRELPDRRLTIQVAPDDCTGCGVCVDVCPAVSKVDAGHKSLDMAPATEVRPGQRVHWDFFLELPDLDRSLVSHDTVKGSQLLRPLFEFPGACAGCGETPYLKLISQLFGDRLIVANATGCSSIYGGNLPTTPWCTNDEGRGPAWANSLFEDNAEFGLGIRLALDREQATARRLVEQLASAIGEDLARELLDASQATESEIGAQRGRVRDLRDRLVRLNGDPVVVRLAAVADALVRTSLWMVGGDGWAYDIGFGGLDHALASGRDINVLVLDTEVYSNTGGQASKATPRGAVARFATAGKRTGKKDLGMLAMTYGNVYVAQIAIGANDRQAVKALLEAEAWPGPSLVIAYSTCIEHGIEMATSMTHQRDAVRSGYWPLYRYHPGAAEHEHPFRLDSHPPAIPVREFALAERRFATLTRSDPDLAEELLTLAQADVDERWRLYEQLAGVERTMANVDGNDAERGDRALLG